MALSLGFLKRELDFSESAGVVYGNLDDYIATFSLKAKEIEIFIDAKVDPSNNEVVDKLRTFIQSYANTFKITASSLSSTGVSITVGERDQEGVLELFYHLLNQLKFLKVEGNGICANCGDAIQGKRHLVKIGTHVHACDEVCADRIMSSEKAAVAKTKVKKRGFPAFLGSILFSIIGILPYLVLGYYGLPCYFAAFAIPISCAVGFFLFGGKRGWVKLLTCLVLPVLFFGAAVIGALGYSIYDQWLQAGYYIEVQYVWDAMLAHFHPLTGDLFSTLYDQLMYGGIFVLLGYLFTLPTAYARADPYFAILKES